ncbi:extensin-like [Melanotaenia boesemani]|uniref:extensin-like n=1 Tax=Melanotaenia boesemani TaxID=1250792 RepID=UPI001C055895|nr:extensin-like [Melanotaenia boesemani]
MDFLRLLLLCQLLVGRCQIKAYQFGSAEKHGEDVFSASEPWFPVEPVYPIGGPVDSSYPPKLPQNYGSLQPLPVEPVYPIGGPVDPSYPPKLPQNYGSLQPFPVEPLYPIGGPVDSSYSPKLPQNYGPLQPLPVEPVYPIEGPVDSRYPLKLPQNYGPLQPLPVLPVNPSHHSKMAQHSQYPPFPVKIQHSKGSQVQPRSTIHLEAERMEPMHHSRSLVGFGEFHVPPKHVPLPEQPHYKAKQPGEGFKWPHKPRYMAKHLSQKQVL